MVPLSAEFYKAVIENDPKRDILGNESNITARYRAQKEYLNSDNDNLEFAFDFTEDQMWTVDYLEQEVEGIVGQLVRLKKPDQVVYMGYSFGGGAVGTTAVLDEARTVGCINLDGWHQNKNLFGKTSPVPYLLFTSKPFDIMNEFFFEPWSTLGTNPDIFRVELPNMTHADFTDAIFLVNPLRKGFGGGNLDTNTIHGMLRSFVIGFLSYCYDPDSTWTKEESLAENPDVKESDMAYIRDWAHEEFDGAPDPASSCGMPSNLLLFLLPAAIVAFIDSAHLRSFALYAFVLPVSEYDEHSSRHHCLSTAPCSNILHKLLKAPVRYIVHLAASPLSSPNSD